MEKLEKIKGRILAAIRKEEARTRSEIEELSRKQHASMGAYGVGGPYQRYERAIGRRQDHLSELEALRMAQCSVTVLEPLRLYGYHCPSCNERIYLQGRDPETLGCPICSRRIYRDGFYTEWSVQKDSRITYTSTIYERTRRII